MLLARVHVLAPLAPTPQSRAVALFSLPCSRSAKLVPRATAAQPPATDDMHKAYRAECEMLSRRLSGVVNAAVSESLLLDPAAGGGPAVARVEHPNVHSELQTPAEMAAELLRCLDAQLQSKKFMSAGDETGDIMAGFPSATLLYYPEDGLQGVLEHTSAAASQVLHSSVAGSSAVGLLRALAAAVGRLALQPGAEAAQGKAAAVMTCLYGMAEALEGATKRPRRNSRRRVTGSLGSMGSMGSMSMGSMSMDVVEPAAFTAVGLEASELFKEVTALVNCIASSTSALSSRVVEGHTVSPSAPAHPLLAALETRLFAAATWRPRSAAHIAAGLVDGLADLMGPARMGNTFASGGSAARTAACNVLHSLARAQESLTCTLTLHGVRPGAASRLFASLAEALAAACITRDAADLVRGPRPSAMFGEAQVLVGLSMMASGDSMVESGSPTASRMSMDVAGGDSSSDPRVGVNDASLVLEVLADQARGLAKSHREHISQVLQDLRDVPRSLGALSSMPDKAARRSGGGGSNGPSAPSRVSPTAAAAGKMLESAMYPYAEVVALEAAASIAAERAAAMGDEPPKHQQQQQQIV